MNLKDIQEMIKKSDGTLNRKARRQKEKKTGTKIVGLNVPYTRLVPKKKKYGEK